MWVALGGRMVYLGGDMTTSAPWYRRWWRSLTSADTAESALERAVTETPREHRAGGDYFPYPASAGYSPLTATSAAAAFPWIYATLPRVADDLSRLPIRMSTGGRKTEALLDHEWLRLLEQPNSQTPGVLFRRQLVFDRRASGNAYILKLYDARKRLVSLVRLHPESVRPVPAPSGLIDHYVYSHAGVEVQYAVSAIIHVRSVSWEDTPQGLMGTGQIQPLNSDLETDAALQKRQRTAATAGRPSYIAAPAREDGVAAAARLTEDQMAPWRKKLGELLRTNQGGVALVGQPLDLTRLDYAPAELEALEARRELTKTVLAVAGVPPIRVGLETANYATALQQSTVYWGDELQAEAALFDAAYTMHARMETGQPDLYIYHDFSGVPVLQEQRTASLGRVSMHIAHGMDPTAAYQYEGFDDLPPSALGAPGPAPTAGAVEESAARPVGLVVPFPAAAEAVRRDIRAPEVIIRGDDSDEKVWASWRARMHAPAERAYRRTVGPYLRAERERVLARLDALYGQRDFATDVALMLLPPEADSALREALIGPLTDSLRKAFADGAEQVDSDVTWTPGQSDPLVEETIAQQVRAISAGTRSAIREAVIETIREGKALSELAGKLVTSDGFSPARALAIARTEATRSVSAGAIHAWSASNARYDLGLRKGWLAELDGVTRPAHLALAGQVVPIDGVFVVPASPGVPFNLIGETAPGPGQFTSAALVVNCRCAARPIRRSA